MSDIPDVMYAAYINERGPAKNIIYGTLPVPSPLPSEVLIKSAALGVNHVDTFIRSGAVMVGMTFPFIIGRDVVGTVVKVGSDVQGFREGQWVWCNSLGFDGRPGAFAEYCAVAAERLYHLPSEADPAEAAAVVHAAATACVGLFRDAKIGRGETVVVHGAGGAVGSAVVQLASAAGAKVIATTRAGNLSWSRECGAEEALDYTEPELHKRIRKLAPDGVDVYWDNSGRPEFENNVRLLGRGGRIVVLAGLNARPSLPVGELYTRDGKILGFAITNASVPDLAAAATQINKRLADGSLRARIGARYDLADARAVHERLEQDSRGLKGRIVVTP
jgi:NADPH:quinone reductase-like Zn-dependent oxidoreductase